MDIASLALGTLAILTSQHPEEGQPAPPSRFIACPGNPRCPSRPHVGVSGGSGDDPPLRGLRPDASYFPPDGSLTISFESGGSDLEDSDRRLLDEWAAPLAISSSVAIVIEGHADESSPIGEDALLAARRAEAVADHLAGRGIASERVSVIAWGSSEEGTVDGDETYLRGLRAVVITTGK